MIKFGVHTSIAGGIDQAVIAANDLDCDTIQIFTSNPRGWKVRDLPEAEVEQFQAKLKEYNIGPVIIHAPYLINLASPKDELYQKSIKALEQQLERGTKIGAEYLVLHPGSHTGSGVDAGIDRIINALDTVLSMVDTEVEILLENVAGAGTAIGTTIEELGIIYNNLTDKSQVGICFDTCHGFAAGYNLVDNDQLDKLLLTIDDIFGLDKLGVIHANDCKGQLNSNKDRHHHIGQGEIGRIGFTKLVNHVKLEDKPFILETPIDDQGDDRSNLAEIRKLVHN
ncbi:MAG: deoxyribonuclease IV [Bacillota bacterium]